MDAPTHNAHRMKSFQVALNQLKKEVAEFKADVTKQEQSLAEAKRLERETQAKIHDIEQKLKELHASPTVSEHALLRYCERVLGIDLEQCKNAILTAEVTEQVKALKSGRFPIGGGHKALVKDFVVRSVI